MTAFIVLRDIIAQLEPDNLLDVLKDLTAKVVKQLKLPVQEDIIVENQIITRELFVL